MQRQMQIQMFTENLWCREKKILSAFYSMMSDAQDVYLFGCISSQPPRLSLNAAGKHRDLSVNYVVNTGTVNTGTEKVKCAKLHFRICMLQVHQKSVTILNREKTDRQVAQCAVNTLIDQPNCKMKYAKWCWNIFDLFRVNHHTIVDQRMLAESPQASQRRIRTAAFTEIWWDSAPNWKPVILNITVVSMNGATYACQNKLKSLNIFCQLTAKGTVLPDRLSVKVGWLNSCLQNSCLRVSQ